LFRAWLAFPVYQCVAGGVALYLYQQHPFFLSRTAVADRVKPREQFVYCVYELCDTRVFTRARIHAHRDGCNIVNVSRVSRPCVSVYACVPLHAFCTPEYMRACVRACVRVMCTWVCLLYENYRYAPLCKLYWCKAIF